LEICHKNLINKNNKYSDEQNKNALEVIRQKIKKLMIEGKINTVEQLKEALEKSKEEYDNKIPENDLKEENFIEWKEKVYDQFQLKLSEEEKEKYKNKTN